jgi:RND superfamily putative drug exporter
MSEYLAALARAISHYWKRSLAIAVASLVILVALAGTAGDPPPDDFRVPGSESQAAIDLFTEHTPALAGVDSNVVFSTESGTLRTSERRASIESSIEEIRSLPSVISVTNPFDPRMPRISEDGRIAAADVRYDLDYGEVEPVDGERLEEAARTAESGGVDVSLRGPVVDVASQQEAPIGELVGVLIAIVLLTLLFRSGAAMFATLVGALIGVMTGQLLLVLLTGPLGLPDFAPTIALMLGLGAGIDYALLIIGRFREQS